MFKKISKKYRNSYFKTFNKKVPKSYDNIQDKNQKGFKKLQKVTYQIYKNKTNNNHIYLKLLQVTKSNDRNDHEIHNFV